MYHLFEDQNDLHFYPLAQTRGIFELPYGAFRLIDLWTHLIGEAPSGLKVRPVLATVVQERFPQIPVNQNGAGIYLNARLLPNEDFWEEVQAATVPTVWLSEGAVIAANRPPNVEGFFEGKEALVDGIAQIRRFWDLHDGLENPLTEQLLKFIPAEQSIRGTVEEGAILVGKHQIYLAPTATIEAGAIVHAKSGPVYIDEGAHIAAGAVVRGSCYIGKETQIKSTAVIDQSAFGSLCKVGGEVHATILFSYSNKGHDGYLGNALIGQWCNLGAATNCSNLKNDYGMVKAWNEALKSYEATGKQFLGLTLGDHSKCGINTMFNTGTVVGVMCNLYGADYHAQHIGNFAWGNKQSGYIPFRIEKALKIAEIVMQRRKKALSDAEKRLFEDIKNLSIA